MLDWIKKEWEAVKKSGTMLFAWVQAAVGIIGAAMIDIYSDPNLNEAVKAVLDPKYIPWYILGFGLLLRFVRKKNATDL